MAKVERATALALIDLGQRKFLVPLPKWQPTGSCGYIHPASVS